MKIERYETPPADGGESGLPAGVPWARFGRETLVVRDDGGEASGSRRGGAADELHVVVQNGRLFQQHHREIPVLHDRGRFLLVRIDPARARRLAREEETCYGLFPLADGAVVFEHAAVAARRGADASVQARVARLDPDRFRENVARLAGLHTRYSTSDDFVHAAERARGELEALGYATRVQELPVEGATSRNVIADRAGTGTDPRGVVIVTAHLDSVNLRGGPAARAPGADDNASGSAGVLEIAHAFQNHQGADDLRLILFGGEEQGLHGSKEYLASLSTAERGRIRAVVNMDMIASLNGPDRTVLIEGAPLSQGVIDGLAEAAAVYTGLEVETSLRPFASDHVPFIEARIPAVLAIEGADNTNDTIHSDLDTPDRITPDYAVEILAMVVGFVAETIGA